MFHRVAHAVLEGLVVLAMALVAGVALAVWRLSQGPVPLDLLVDYMAPALEEAMPGYDVRVGRAELVWRGWERGLDLRLAGLEIDAPSGARIARLSEATLRLSRDALLRGHIAPTSLGVEGPEFRIERRADGTLQVAGFGGETLPLDALASPDAGPAVAEPGERLREILVTRARIRLEDQASGSVWEARDADLRLGFSAQGTRVEARAILSRAGHAVPLNAVFERPAAPGRAGLTIGFDDLAPAVVAGIAGDLFPQAKTLSSIGGSFGGRIELGLDAGGALRDARAELAAAGTVALSDAAMFPRTAPLSAMAAELRYDVALRRLDLDRLRLGFAGGGTGEMRATMTHDGAGAMRIAATAVVRDLPADALATFWPLPLAPNARSWVTSNLSGGVVDHADFEFSVAGDRGGTVRATGLASKIRFRGMTVGYLSPLPPATGVEGMATLALDRVLVTTQGGAVGGLRVESSRTLLTALDTNDERAEIHVAVRGPVRDQLELLDQPPLGFMKAVAMNPAEFGGEGLTRARFLFPLARSLRVDQVAVAGTIEAKGFSLKRAALGQDAHDGEIAGRFDEKGLTATGKLILGRTPVEVEYGLGFQASAPVRERIRASGTLPPGELAAFGFDLRPYLDGSLPLAVEFVVRRNAPAELRLDAGLEQARLAVAELGWEKPAGVPGSARLDMLLERGRIQRIRGLRIAAGDADLQGQMVFAADGRTIQSVDLERLRFARNDLKVAALRERDGGWRLRLTGPVADLSTLESEDNGAKSGPPPERPRLAIDATLGKLWLADDRAVTDVAFSGERAARWLRARLVAKGADRTGRRDPFEIDYRTDGKDTGALTARSANAGAMLASLGVTDKVLGGTLDVRGATDTTQEGRPLALDIRMRDYRVVDEPALARFLSAALLTGLLDLLRGDGIGFDRLEAQALLADGDLVIRDLRTSGPSLGVQARGRIDFDGDSVDVEGTIVPANALNSLFGRIPLIGEVLFGPGLFAARYSVRGPRDRPEVTINPLSALTPGVLRNIFGILDGGPAGAPAAKPPQR